MNHAETCAEFQCDGLYEGPIHSDLPTLGNTFGMDEKEVIRYLHRALDEWLDKSGGMGYFYIGNVYDLHENFCCMSEADTDSFRSVAEHLTTHELLKPKKGPE